MNYLAHNADELATIFEEQGVESFSDPVVFPCVVAIKDGQVVASVSKADFYPDIEGAMEKVAQVLGWYNSVYVEGNPNPGGLSLVVRAQAVLSSNLETIGHEKARLISEVDRLEFLRMRKKSTFKIAYRAEGDTAANAEDRARIKIEDIENKCVDAVKAKEEIKALYDTMNKTLVALAQERKRLESDYNRAHLTA